MNVIDKITKFKVQAFDSKLEIWIQKIKVKKQDFNLYFLGNKSNRIYVNTE